MFLFPFRKRLLVVLVVENGPFYSTPVNGDGDGDSVVPRKGICRIVAHK